MNAPNCPQHEKPMTYVGRVPAWEDRTKQAHAWHCSKCTIEVQRPVKDEPLQKLKTES